MKLSWVMCQGDVWCNLDTVNLNHEHFNSMYGVYIIWHGGSNALTVRVGQGFIRDRLLEHRKDSQIQAFSDKILYVTWASVPSSERSSVESFLAVSLQPLVGERFPDVPPIEVNLPW